MTMPRRYTHKGNRKGYKRQNTHTRAYKRYLKRGGEVQPQTQPTDKPNVMSQLFGIGAQLASKAIDKGVQGIASLTGTNPNLGAAESIGQLSDKAKNIAYALQTPKGKQLMSNLSNVVDEGVEQLKEPLGKLANVGNTLLEKEVDKAQKIAVDVATDIAGPLISIPKTVYDVSAATQNAAEAASDATGILKDQVDEFKDIQGKVSDAWSDVVDLASETASNQLASVNQGLQEQTNKLQSQAANYQQQVSDLQGQSLNPDLKQLHKQGTMIGGRALKSQQEFTNGAVGVSIFAPYTKKSKVLPKTGGTRRRRY
jgi:gas vesicle protein